MNNEIHFFDLDNTLWVMNTDIWIIDKEKPYLPIMKINNLEFNLIKNGLYIKDNLPLDYNGNRFYINKKTWEIIKKKKKTENINRFGISFKNFGTKEDINKTKVEFILDNVKHLVNKNVYIGILTARTNQKIHSDLINSLRLELKNLGLSLDKIFFVGDKFTYHDDDLTSLKKTHVLIEHLIGYKISNNKFISSKQDSYDNIHFYDDVKLNIDYANNIQEILDNILKRTDDELFKVIINRIKNNNIRLSNHLITNNDLNRFKTTNIIIKDPVKYPLKEEVIYDFNNFIKNL